MKLNTSFLCSLLLILYRFDIGIGDQGFAAEPIFKAGAAKRDITPQEPVPMWGYGADSQVAPAAVGAGEKLMNTALMWLFQMQGKLK